MVFGKVVEGLSILKKIEAVPTSGQRNKPDVPIKIVDCGEMLHRKENGVVSVKDGMFPTSGKRRGTIQGSMGSSFYYGCVLLATGSGWTQSGSSLVDFLFLTNAELSGLLFEEIFT